MMSLVKDFFGNHMVRLVLALELLAAITAADVKIILHILGYHIGGPLAF